MSLLIEATPYHMRSIFERPIFEHFKVSQIFSEYLIVQIFERPLSLKRLNSSNSFQRESSLKYLNSQIFEHDLRDLSQTRSRLIHIGLFCRISSLLYGSFAKKTYHMRSIFEQYLRESLKCAPNWDIKRGGGLGSRPKKMYGERLGDGVEYHLMSPTPRR